MDMTFNFSPDSYKVTILNTHSLIVESYNIYRSLKHDTRLEKYYAQYLPTVIDEIILSLKKDSTAHEILGYRYNEYIEVLCNSKSSSLVFENNIHNLLELFSKRKYYDLLRNNITKIIHTSKDAKKLSQLTNNWLCELSYLGYSMQHINAVTQSFFTETNIDSPDIIEDYFDKYDFKKAKWDLLYFTDSKLAEYYCGSLHEVIGSDSIMDFHVVPYNELGCLTESNPKIKWIKRYYDNENRITDRKIAVINAKVVDYDPYNATKKLKAFIRTISDIVTVFDNERKVRLNKAACLNYKYKHTIQQISSMDKRNRDVTENYLNKTTAVLKQLNASNVMINQLINAFSFHNDALLQGSEGKYVITMLWTALESLFVNDSEKRNKASQVKNCLIEIIQRTYIVKMLKYLQADVLQNLKYKDPNIITKYHLNDIKTFIDSMFDNTDSERVKEITATLVDNPLLRLRIYLIIDEKLKNGKSINEMLETHRKKVEWQIDRIYRSRNFLVHSGNEFPFNDSLIENLHNYYDFIVNYILLKGSRERIIDINSIVNEAKLDNNVHAKLLSMQKKVLTKDNINELLFGPSTNVLCYYCESTI